MKGWADSGNRLDFSNGAGFVLIDHKSIVLCSLCVYNDSQITIVAQYLQVSLFRTFEVELSKNWTS